MCNNQIILSPEELLEKESITKEHTKKVGNITVITSGRGLKYSERMVASDSLFPCFHIYPFIKNKENEALKLKSLSDIINNPTSTERDILKFFSNSRNLNLLSVLFANYRFGHHDQYIFREFPLPNANQIADFLLIGKNSDGYHEIFVEFEAINSSKLSKVFTKDRREGVILRKGREQTQDWENSLTKLYVAHSAKLREYVNPSKVLPTELQENSPFRRNYLIVAGRRKDFQNNYETRLQIEAHNNVKIIHYDNIIESIQKTLLEKNIWY